MPEDRHLCDGRRQRKDGKREHRTPPIPVSSGITQKLCAKCRTIKPIVDFSTRRHSSLAERVYESYCAPCRKQTKQDSHRLLTANPIEHWVRNSWGASRHRAFKVGVAHDLSRQQLRWLAQTTADCPYCGSPLTYRHSGILIASSASLDRIIPRDGYVLSNVTIACHRCNSLKNAATVEELMRLIAAIPTTVEGSSREEGTVDSARSVSA